MFKRSRRAVNAESVELRNIDGIDLEGQSSKEDGNGAKGQTTEEKLKAHMSTKRKGWNTFFLLSCAFAIFNDPLYCYIEFIDNTNMCITWNDRSVMAYIAIRLCVDVFYIIDLMVSCLGTRNKRRKITKRLGPCRNIKDTAASSSKGDDKITLKARFKNISPYISRILVALPILEGLVLSSKSYSDFVFFTFVAIQYTLRVFHIYEVLRQRPIIGDKSKIWLKPILDFVPFILASHLFGAIWYLLALKRQVDCWTSNCKDILGDQCDTYFSICSTVPVRVNMTLLEEFCPTKEENPNVFDFGIYLYAIKANVTDSKSGLRLRVSQSFWWALRNLSSFGSNLNSGMNSLEILFCVVISISGMALFLVYLNARVQETQENSSKLKLKEKNLVALPEIDLWLSKTDFPKDLMTTATKKKRNMREVIMENIHKLGEDKEFDVQNILSILPLRDRRRVLYHLRLASLRKVSKLGNMNEKVLREISEYMKPVVYVEDDYIFQEGKPLGKILFITQGNALTYTSGRTSCGSSSTRCLEKDDLYGEDLLDWAFKFFSFSDLPVSTRTVMTQEKVEGFVIRANDLINVVSKFWWYFSWTFCQVADSRMEQRDHLAASSIQAAWRRRRNARLRRQNWGKFTVN